MSALETDFRRVGPKILIFNQQGRTEAIDFLDGLCHTAKAADGVGFQHVIFCTNVTYAEAGYKRGTCASPPPSLHKAYIDFLSCR